ncbi:MAG: ABC transporter permease [Candidatus Nanopelagicales bacterium]|jgi:osmoprotectant transport system permease protein
MSALQDLVAWFTDPAQWTGSSGIPARLLQHALICAWAMAIAIAVALPAGLWLGHRHRWGTLVTSVGNLGRAIPTFALLIILASWEPVGVSDLAAVIALAVFAIPPILSNAYVGVRDVDTGATDAATGMGMTGRQVLWRVELPLSVPVVAAGIRTSTVQVVATATLAALVGGGGLGRFVVDGFGRQDPTLMFAGVVLVAITCVVVELVGSAVQRALTPRALRGGTVLGTF